MFKEQEQNGVLNEFMVSNASCKPSTTQFDVHFVNYGLIWTEIDYIVGLLWGNGHLVIDKLLIHVSLNTQSAPIGIS